MTRPNTCLACFISVLWFCRCKAPYLLPATFRTKSLLYKPLASVDCNVMRHVAPYTRDRSHGYPHACDRVGGFSFQNACHLCEEYIRGKAVYFKWIIILFRWPSNKRSWALLWYVPYWILVYTASNCFWKAKGFVQEKTQTWIDVLPEKHVYLISPTSRYGDEKSRIS